MKLKRLVTAVVAFQVCVVALTFYLVIKGDFLSLALFALVLLLDSILNWQRSKATKHVLEQVLALNQLMFKFNDLRQLVQHDEITQDQAKSIFMADLNDLEASLDPRPELQLTVAEWRRQVEGGFWF